MPVTFSLPFPSHYWHARSADYGLAVGPFPELDPAAAEPKPVSFALADSKAVKAKQIPFAGHPAMLKALCGKYPLNLLRLALMEQT